MHNLYTRIAGLVLAFGLFIGCSTVAPTSSRKNKKLSSQQLKTRIANIDDTLANQEPAADIYYQKGYLLSELAQRESLPSKRVGTYKKMRMALEKAEQMYDEQNLPSGSQKVDELLKVRWSSEHNQGVQIIQKDSTLENNDFEMAANYFKNSTIILPDSSISYKLEAQTYYRYNKYDEAIAVLERARANIDPLPSDMLEQLAYLYLETDHPQKAVSVYEDAESFSNENLNLIHGLANAYITVGNHQKASETLDLLVDSEPDNVIYAQTQGIELYFWGAEKVDALRSTHRDDQKVEAHNTLFVQADSLFIQAEKQLKHALSLNSDSSDLETSMARFYQNASAQYKKLLPYLPTQTSREIKGKIEHYLKSSIPLYISLSRENPGGTGFWKNLYQVYSYLGMSREAGEAKKKLNR